MEVFDRALTDLQQVVEDFEAEIHRLQDEIAVAKEQLEEMAIENEWLHSLKSPTIEDASASVKTPKRIKIEKVNDDTPISIKKGNATRKLPKKRANKQK